MKILCKQVFAAFLLFLPALEAKSAPMAITYQDKVFAPVYPVVVKEAQVAATFQEDSEEPIYEQVFFPRSLVKIDDDLTVPYMRPDRNKAENKTVKIEAGTIFVEANLGSNKVYCASVGETKLNNSRYVDLGICLSDAQHSGIFTQAVSFASFAPDLPERHDYDVKQVENKWYLKNPAVSEVSVKYEDVPVDDSYASKIEIRVIYHPIPEHFYWAPILDISPKLMRPGFNINDNAVGGFQVNNFHFKNIVSVLGFREDIGVTGEWWKIYMPGHSRHLLTFGSPISVQFDKEGEKLWRLDFHGELSPGNYILDSVISDGLFGLEPAKSN